MRCRMGCMLHAAIAYSVCYLRVICIVFSLSTLDHAIPFLSAGALRASIACLSRVEVVLGVISTVVNESPIHTMHGMPTLASLGWPAVELRRPRLG